MMKRSKRKQMSASVVQREKGAMGWQWEAPRSALTVHGTVRGPHFMEWKETLQASRHAPTASSAEGFNAITR